MAEQKLPIKWPEVEKELDNLRAVQGGFSQARRGLLTLPDGTQVFVKLGLHENTKRWAKKEVGVYRFLKKHNYTYIPELLSVNEDESGFAITAYAPEDGWDWKENWTEERLDKTLEAMDALAALLPQGNDLQFFPRKAINESDDGWKPLLESAAKPIWEGGPEHLRDFQLLAGLTARFSDQVSTLGNY